MRTFAERVADVGALRELGWAGVRGRWPPGRSAVGHRGGRTQVWDWTLCVRMPASVASHSLCMFYVVCYIFLRGRPKVHTRRLLCTSLQRFHCEMQYHRAHGSAAEEGGEVAEGGERREDDGAQSLEVRLPEGEPIIFQVGEIRYFGKPVSRNDSLYYLKDAREILHNDWRGQVPETSELGVWMRRVVAGEFDGPEISDFDRFPALTIDFPGRVETGLRGASLQYVCVLNTARHDLMPRPFNWRHDLVFFAKVRQQGQRNLHSNLVVRCVPHNMVYGGRASSTLRSASLDTLVGDWLR